MKGKIDRLRFSIADKGLWRYYESTIYEISKEIQCHDSFQIILPNSLYFRKIAIRTDFFSWRNDEISRWNVFEDRSRGSFRKSSLNRGISIVCPFRFPLKNRPRYHGKDEKKILFLLTDFSFLLSPRLITGNRIITLINNG